jgi:hypothetical protein
MNDDLKLFNERHMAMIMEVLTETEESEKASHDKLAEAWMPVARKFIQAMNEAGLNRAEMAIMIDVFRTYFLDQFAEHIDRADEFETGD